MNEKNLELTKLYEQTYGEPPQTIYYSFAHDSIRFLLLAIVKTAVQHKDGTLVIGRQALRDSLYEIGSFDGITGDLSCDKFGDCGIASFSIMQLVELDAGVNGLRQNVVYTYNP